MNGAESIAAFPMYDFAALEVAHDQLWTALRAHLTDCGIADAPMRLTRGMQPEKLWVNPNLLLAQACEFPLAKRFTGRVRIVATPRYAVQGCAGSRYRSAILVRCGQSAASLKDLRGLRCVINDPLSNSGMNLLRASIAPLAKKSDFFSEVLVSGSHHASARSVTNNDADVCAVDCVTLAHLRRFDPSSVESLRIIAWTPSTPSLPLVTAGTASDATVERLRNALRRVVADPVTIGARAELRLAGFDVRPEEGFVEVLQLEQRASLWGYTQLH
jgi:ABC-type phosphate/phosphonate transport system substrate-binding protein